MSERPVPSTCQVLAEHEAAPNIARKRAIVRFLVRNTSLRKDHDGFNRQRVPFGSFAEIRNGKNIDPIFRIMFAFRAHFRETSLPHEAHELPLPS